MFLELLVFNMVYGLHCLFRIECHISPYRSLYQLWFLSMSMTQEAFFTELNITVFPKNKRLIGTRVKGCARNNLKAKETMKQLIQLTTMPAMSMQQMEQNLPKDGLSNGVVERKKTRVSVCDAPTF